MALCKVAFLGGGRHSGNALGRGVPHPPRSLPEHRPRGSPPSFYSQCASALFVSQRAIARHWVFAPRPPATSPASGLRRRLVARPPPPGGLPPHSRGALACAVAIVAAPRPMGVWVQNIAVTGIACAPPVPPATVSSGVPQSGQAVKAASRRLRGCPAGQALTACPLCYVCRYAAWGTPAAPQPYQTSTVGAAPPPRPPLRGGNP